jgi:hypothetical protein|tara:strand:+ start:26 stop:496 length:471 start_codon:yes stop_codon:yes gene_type:complete
MSDFQFHPYSDAPGHQLVTESISSFTLQAIAGLIIKLGKMAKDAMPEGDPDHDAGDYLQDLGKEFGQQVLSQCHHVGAVDLDVPISFTVPVEYVSDICKILTNALKMGKVTPEMHDAWTPFALESIKHIPGGDAMLRKVLFMRDNPEHPGLRAELN